MGISSATSAASPPPPPVSDLDHLPFVNRFTTQLPGDTEHTNELRQVHGALYSEVAPTPVSAPVTLAFSPEVADLLGIDLATCASDDFAAVFSGNRVPAGGEPFAATYGGHQFGNWAGQLGDGRAIALGEVLDVNDQHQTLQLKGAGPTPYSRGADGRAVLRSSVREFLCSEAMFHLGIPTTRALSLVSTGDPIMRDMLYDGNQRPEPGAVVCRVAPSFIRFGTFELPASRGDIDLLTQLVEFTIRNDFPELYDPEVPVEQLVDRWFREVCDRTAALVVDWMRVGFVHGVLNTDNMSILGLTIDYGPYGWLEDFNLDWTPNTTDAMEARYRYGMQPQVAQWNLLQLANALVQVTREPEPFQESLERYRGQFQTQFDTMMSARLGWGAARSGDAELVRELWKLLPRTEIDQVIFYRELAKVPVGRTGGAAGAEAGSSSASDNAITDDELLAPLAEAFYAPDEVAGELRDDLCTWLRTWGARVMAGAGGLADDSERRAQMDARNPRYVLRNYLAQEAIDLAEDGDAGLINELLEVLRHPYDDQPGRERFAARRPEWARHRVGCSQLSCSS
ncbi:MAG: YdiU family protein [Thermoleophilia bacterium]|nr:YdiU family protein [Thermoleophilia bacterium]